MRDIVLPAVLLCASTGMALGVGKAPLRRSISAAMVAASVSVLARWAADIPAEETFAAIWVAIIASAATALSGERIARALALPMALVAGGMTGLLVDWRIVFALAAFPIALAAARFFATAGKGIAVKVVAGWLLAIAVLNVTLAMLPVTPGYLPDHLE